MLLTLLKYSSTIKTGLKYNDFSWREITDIKNFIIVKKLLELNTVSLLSIGSYFCEKSLGITFKSFLALKDIDVIEAALQNARNFSSVMEQGDITWDDFLKLSKKEQLQRIYNAEKEVIRLQNQTFLNRRQYNYTYINPLQRKKDFLSGKYKRIKPLSHNEQQTHLEPITSNKSKKYSVYTGCIKRNRNFFFYSLIGIGVGLSAYSGYQCSKAYQQHHTIDIANTNTILGILGVSCVFIGIILLCCHRNQHENDLEIILTSENNTANVSFHSTSV
jgi:hypothetical protein